MELFKSIINKIITIYIVVGLVVSLIANYTFIFNNTDIYSFNLKVVKELVVIVYDAATWPKYIFINNSKDNIDTDSYQIEKYSGEKENKEALLAMKKDLENLENKILEIIKTNQASEGKWVFSPQIGTCSSLDTNQYQDFKDNYINGTEINPDMDDYVVELINQRALEIYIKKEKGIYFVFDSQLKCLKFERVIKLKSYNMSVNLVNNLDKISTIE
ncbi:MAG: hypothetical protein ABII18_05765 [bacterium]